MDESMEQLELNLDNKLSIMDTTRQQENHTNCFLPMEVIIHIISFLDNIEDLHNCMLLSTEIRDLIFRTPGIMRNILINFSKCSWAKIPKDQDQNLTVDPQIEFLQIRGKFFRCLELKIDKNSEEIFKFILNLVPNLESLDFEVIDQESELKSIFESDQESPNLKTLKTLKITHNALTFFIKNTKNAKNLQNLSIISPKVDNQEALTDFIVQQDNLQEFTMRLNTAMDIINFPTRDITKEVKFRLKKLSLCFVNSNREQFIDFLKSQAAHLEELELNYKPNREILKVVFKRCQKLTILTLNSHGDSPVFSNLNPHWQLPMLRKYRNKSFSVVQLRKIFMRFPNLQALVTWKLIDSVEVCSQLKSLEVGLLYYHQIEHLKLPGLTSLTILMLSGDYNEQSWIKFAKNVNNVENLIIKDFQDVQDVQIVVKYLNIFENLKIFQLGCLKRVGYASVIGAVLSSFKDQQFFNMTIDIERRFIIYSRFISIRFPEIFDILMDNFRGFELVEYNVHKAKVIEVFGGN